jgi:isoquinoline 1-oxidoreductase beta subunit
MHSGFSGTGMARNPDMNGIDRRTFLVGAALGGGLSLGLHLPASARAETSGDGREINAWIVIRPDDTVIVRVARSEMGQGVFTALPMILAEELCCDFAKVVPKFAAPAENLRRQRVFGDMSTNASRSVSASQIMLRTAGATAREMLIAAAADRWDAPASECHAARGIIRHEPSGRSVAFGAVAEAAAKLAPPKDVALKVPKDWTLIGTPQRRLDVPDKVTGKPVYGIDVRVPGMLYAAIVQCPVFGGRLRALDAAKALAMTGVRRIVRLPDAVAVVAEGWWQASRAAAALAIDWDDGGNGALTSEAIVAKLRDGLDHGPVQLGRSVGDTPAALRTAITRIEADYAVPYLAHATMEPQNCTAHVADGRVEVWAPTQDGDTALAVAAAAAGVPREQVIVHKTMLGGGFGRRGPIQDFVRQAVLIAKETRAPVKLIWSREQDMQHDFYRPPAMARMTAGLDAAGLPIALAIRLAGQSIAGATVPDLMPDMAPTVAEPVFFGGLDDTLPYELPNLRLEYALSRTPVPIGLLRGVYQAPNVFFRECFIDEMAYAAGADPYAFRRRLAAAQPRVLAVLDAAAARAGWDRPPPPGQSRGIALDISAGTVNAQVVELSVSSQGAIRLHRVVAAIDPGIAVNPLTIELQVQSAIVFGLTAALHGEIGIAAGGTVQSNFHDYKMLRMAEVPCIETMILQSGGRFGGIGEPPVTPVAPALCNALFAATGTRVRTMPLSQQTLRPRS